MQSELLDRVRTDHCILRENVDAIFRRFRVKFSGRAKLLDRTHHAIGLNAAQLTLFDLDAAFGHFSVMIARDPSAI